MNVKVFTALSLSAFLAVTSQAHAAGVKKSVKVVEAPMTIEKPLSPIEKALSQQKRDRSANKGLEENDQIKAMTSLKVAPTQNFLAAQHQRFSRFVQAIFPQHSS